VVSAQTAAEWIGALLGSSEVTHETAAAVVQLGRRVDDRARDISQDVARSAVSKLKSAEVADDASLRPLQEYIVPTRPRRCPHAR
jgi:DNA-K related protein